MPDVKAQLPALEVKADCTQYTLEKEKTPNCPLVGG